MKKINIKLILISAVLGLAATQAAASNKLSGGLASANQACDLLCGLETAAQSDDGSRLRIDGEGFIWYWHPILKKWYYSSRLGHVGNKANRVHISEFFTDAETGRTCIETYPGYGWGMAHFCLSKEGIALIQDEEPGGYKGRGTVAYSWVR